MTRFERYWLVPATCVFVALAEYSRYLTSFRFGEIVFAPRNFFVVGLLTLAAWKTVVFFNKQRRTAFGDWHLLIVPAVVLGWLIVSMLLSPYENATPLGLEWLNGLVLLLLIGLAARPIVGSKWFGISLVVGVVGIVGVGLVEKIIDVHLPLSNLHNPYRQQWAISSVFIGQNHLAASLGLLLPIVSGFALAWRGTLRWLSLAVVLGGLVCVFFTGSTLTLVALVIALAVFGGVALYKAKPGIKKRLGFAIVSIGLMLIASWFALPSSIKDRISIGTVGVRQSLETRLDLIQRGIELIREHPLIGHGPGAVSELVAVTLNNQPTVRALHNFVLDFAVTYGLGATVLILAWLLWVTVRVFRRLSGSGQRWPTTGVLASLLALVIISAVPSTFEGVRAPFIVIGFALALALRPRPAHR